MLLEKDISLLLIKPDGYMHKGKIESDINNILNLDIVAKKPTIMFLNLLQKFIIVKIKTSGISEEALSS